MYQGRSFERVDPAIVVDRCSGPELSAALFEALATRLIAQSRDRSECPSVGRRASSVYGFPADEDASTI